MKFNQLRSNLLIIVMGSLLFYSTAFASPEAEKSSAKEEVRAAAIAFNNAYAENKLDEYFAFYVDDATLMSPDGSIQTVAEYYVEWKEFLASGGGVARLGSHEPTSIRTSADGLSAVTYFTSDTTVYVDADGKETGSDTAETDIWWKIGGEWKVVHIHYHQTD